MPLSMGGFFVFLKKYIIIKSMESILPENEYTDFEERQYLNPQISIDETNSFIDQLRLAQGQQNQGILQQTQNLGMTVPSNLGGLTGSNSYFASRYQTPQTNANIANLRSATQAKAMNDVLSNEQAKWKKRYQDAYNAYQKSAYDKTRALTSGGLSGGGVSAQSLGYDVNSGLSNSGYVNIPSNVTPGEYIPVSSSSGYYLSNDGKWWQLSNPTGSEMTWNLGIAPLIGSHFSTVKNAQNGDVWDFGGKTFLYIQNQEYPNGRWFRGRVLGDMNS